MDKEGVKAGATDKADNKEGVKSKAAASSSSAKGKSFFGERLPSELVLVRGHNVLRCAVNSRCNDTQLIIAAFSWDRQTRRSHSLYMAELCH